MKQASLTILLLVFFGLHLSSCANIKTLPSSEEIESEKQADTLEAESEASKTLKELRKREAQEELQRIQRSITEVNPAQPQT